MEKDSSTSSSYTPPVQLDDMHHVYIYTGIPVDKLLELDIYQYRVLLINTLVDMASKTEEGRELLKIYSNSTSHITDFDVEGLMSIM